MDCIVADSGPLIALAYLNILDLPHKLFGNVLVPTTVFVECVHSAHKPGSHAIQHAREAALFNVVDDPHIPEQLAHLLLDAGEQAAIALALQRQAAVLIDEARGRRAAERFKVPLIGVCGLLVKAKQTDYIPAIAPLLQHLRTAGYFISDDLCKTVLSLAGEVQ